jgi:hypothetical protein
VWPQNFFLAIRHGDSVIRDFTNRSQELAAQRSDPWSTLLTPCENMFIWNKYYSSHDRALKIVFLRFELLNSKRTYDVNYILNVTSVTGKCTNVMYTQKLPLSKRAILQKLIKILRLRSICCLCTSQYLMSSC